MAVMSSSTIDHLLNAKVLPNHRMARLYHDDASHQTTNKARITMITEGRHTGPAPLAARADVVVPLALTRTIGLPAGPDRLRIVVAGRTTVVPEITWVVAGTTTGRGEPGCCAGKLDCTGEPGCCTDHERPFSPHIKGSVWTLPTLRQPRIGLNH